MIMRPIVRIAAAAAIAFIAGLAPNIAAAEAERILDFQSQIRIHADGSVRVTETIAVASAGRQIKRGIYRDFPTDYRGRRPTTTMPMHPTGTPTATPGG